MTFINHLKIVISYIILIAFSYSSTVAQAPGSYSIMASVVVQSDPPAILISWPENINADEYIIYRRILGSDSWKQPLAQLEGNSTQYIDYEVEKGIKYEYGIFRAPPWIYDTLLLPAGEEITFTIYDSWGDGICCWLGWGFYQLSYENTILAEGGEFTSSESTSFTVPGDPGEESEIILHIYFDNYPEETTWDIKHYNSTLYSGGPYSQVEYTYIVAGIECPALENRGTILLLVDSLYQEPLEYEINQLIYDLVFEGWKVIKKGVNRDLSVNETKEIIIESCEADSSINTLFLVGQIPVPYSGNIAMDGHQDHKGAWPADTYYSVLDGEWTDQYVYNTSASRIENHNIPGDGKFDQNYIPADIYLQTGRVDLSDLPAFQHDEIELTRNYLNKDHNWRSGAIDAVRRGLIEQNLYGNKYDMAWRNFAALFTADYIFELDYSSTLMNESYLCSYGSGGSSYTHCGGIVSTNEFASNNYQTVFTTLFGSYFGDWDNTNNVLRSPLANEGPILINFWSCNPTWHLQFLGLGHTIGYCAQISQNNDIQYTTGFGNRYVHTALMGDPTLTLFVVKPPASLSLEDLTQNGIRLTWDNSPDTSTTYNIYRASSIAGHFEKIAENINVAAYTDESPLGGNNVYLVRAKKLETTGCGSYYNLSPGICDSLWKAVGISNNVKKQSDFKLYPNPGTGKYFIDFHNQKSRYLKIQISDLSGRVLMTENIILHKGSNLISLDISDLSNGIYLMSCFDQIGMMNHTIIKQ